MPTEDTIYIIALVAIVIMSLSLHEVAHATVALWRGDDTAKQLGRITLNPLKHIDPVMTVLVPVLLVFVFPWLFGWTPLPFGGAKPVPVVPSRLHHPLRDMMWVALAGPAMNFALAFLSAICLKALMVGGVLHPGELPTKILISAIVANIVLGVFNLLPIPPLDGSRVLSYVLPDRLRRVYTALTPFGFPIIIGLVFFVPGAQEVLRDWIYWTYDWLAGVVDALFDLFR